MCENYCRLQLLYQLKQKKLLEQNTNNFKLNSVKKKHFQQKKHYESFSCNEGESRFPLLINNQFSSRKECNSMKSKQQLYQQKQRGKSLTIDQGNIYFEHKQAKRVQEQKKTIVIFSSIKADAFERNKSFLNQQSDSWSSQYLFQ